MRVIIEPNGGQVSAWGAAYIAKRINEHNKKEKRPFVLGLPTGSTPLGTYKKLIEYCKAGKVSFANVVTFNMDEYVGIPKDHPEATIRSCGTTSSATSTSNPKTSTS